MKHVLTSTSILVVFSYTNAILLSLSPEGAVPRRDIFAWALGFLLILGAMIIFPRDRASRKSDFRRTFQKLSILEVVFTILIPWCVILVENWTTPTEKANTSKLGFMLASHLFTFQAQISLEAIISFGGERRGWLMFPYTCVANAYRVISIATWWIRARDSDLERNAIELGFKYSLPLIATALWIYSSFVFIPFYWYPAISGKKQVIHKSA